MVGAQPEFGRWRFQFGDDIGIAKALTGSVLVEIIFAWPGLGRYVSESILSKDFPVIAACTLVVTVCYVLMNLVIDLTQAMVDPRVALT